MTNDELIAKLRITSTYRDERWHCVTDPGLLCEAAEALALQQAEIAELKRSAVTAVLPLEVIVTAGLLGTFTPEMQDSIREGIAAVRAAIQKETPDE